LRHQIGTALEIALALALEHLADDIFDRIHGERGVAADRVGIVLHIFLEIVRRQHAVDQTHLQRLGGGELAGGEEDFLGEGRTDQINQLLDALVAVTETELGGRHAEFRIVRADTHVAAQRQADAAADAIAADHGDGRLGKLEDGGVGLVDGLVVTIDRLLAGAFALEL
jgi:hypothetical protein